MIVFPSQDVLEVSLIRAGERRCFEPGRCGIQRILYINLDIKQEK